MQFSKIQELVSDYRFAFTEHAIEEFERRNIATEQIIRTICQGKIIKKEADEFTNGKFTKYTIEDQNLRITLKDRIPPVIISIRVIK